VLAGIPLHIKRKKKLRKKSKRRSKQGSTAKKGGRRLGKTQTRKSPKVIDDVIGGLRNTSGE